MHPPPPTHPFPNRKETPQQTQTKNIIPRFMETPWAFSINNRKKQQLLTLRKIEIDRQNKSLTSRISEINAKRNHHSVLAEETQYLKQPHQQHIRKELFRIVRKENQQNKKRIEEQKTTITAHEFQTKWTQPNNNNQPNKGNNKRQNGHSSARTQQNRHHHSMYQQQERFVKYNKEKSINGNKICLKIQEYNHVYIVSGRIKEKNISVVMVVEKDRLNSILKQKCSGKLQHFTNLLSFDPSVNSLYYLTEEPDFQDEFISDICSQFDLTTLRKAILQQHQLMEQQLTQQYHFEISTSGQSIPHHQASLSIPQVARPVDERSKTIQKQV